MSFAMFYVFAAAVVSIIADFRIWLRKTINIMKILAFKSFMAIGGSFMKKSLILKAIVTTTGSSHIVTEELLFYLAYISPPDEDDSDGKIKFNIYEFHSFLIDNNLLRLGDIKKTLPELEGIKIYWLENINSPPLVTKIIIRDSLPFYSIHAIAGPANGPDVLFNNMELTRIFCMV